MHLQDIHTLYEYNYWANHKLLEIVRTLTEEQYKKDLGSSHGGIHGTLFHQMGAEEIWLMRWKGNSPATFGQAEDYPAFDALSQHWNNVEREMMDFCHRLQSEDDIKRVVAYKDLKGNEYSQPLWQLMQHLANHSTYHRGQIVTLLRQVGAKPVGTDLVAFYRQNPPRK